MARRWKRRKFFGPGKFLFSRALKQELRMQHELQVLIRNLVQKMLQNKYPEWLPLDGTHLVAVGGGLST